MKYRINYDKVKSQITSVKTNIEDLNKELKKIDKIEADLKSSWQGEASSQFQEKLRGLKSELLRTKNQMEKLVDTIQFTVDRIKKEDDENRQKAYNLN